MSGDSADAMHAALVSALKADAELMTLIDGRVVDWPTKDTLFPCVTIGDITSLPWDADDVLGAELIVTLHTWARGSNARTVARQIGEAVTTLLHEREAELSPVGHRVILAQRQLSQVFRDEASDAALGGVTAHGVYRFRFLTVAAD